VSAAPESLAAGLPIAPGGPFHRLLLDSATETIRARLEERGNRRAIVEPRITWDESGLVANVVFEVLEGPRATVEAVVVRGNARTRTDVVRRFVDLAPGDPISTGRMLDVQRGLYRLGIFSRVDVRAPQAAATSEPSEVVVEVEEGRPRAVAYGAGYDSESGVRGLFRFSHANLGGRAASFQLDALVSQKDELFRGLIRQPYFGRWPVEVSATLYDQHEVRPDFDVDRTGAQLGAERRIGARRLGLFAEYRLVDLTTDQPESGSARESQREGGEPDPTAIWDHRDDPTDRPGAGARDLPARACLPAR
jgi:outer membrane protein insertion porin family